MKYSEFTLARADTGAVLPGAHVTVYLLDGVTLATLFQSDGVTSLGNPLTADGIGTIGFTAANATYILAASSADGLYTVPRIRVDVFDWATGPGGGYVPGGADVAVADGGTGTSGLTGYVKASGTSPYTASPSIPMADVTGALPTGQLPALIGDVTATAGTGVTAIAAGAVSLAKQANMATASVVYRKTAGAGPPEVQSLATLKADLGLTGTNSGDQVTTTTSAGAGSSGKLALLDGIGRLDPTLLAPDGWQRVNGMVVSGGLDIGNPGDYSGTAWENFIQVHGTSDLKTGIAIFKWGNDSKSSLDFVAKSRGAVGAFSPLVVGDKVYRRFVQGSGSASQFGHMGLEQWACDKTPTNAGEIGGRYDLSTDTGMISSEASVARPTYFGLKNAFSINSKQQVFLGGKLTAVPAIGSDYGGLLVLGQNATDAGEAVIKFTLTSAALLTTPEAGAFEVDSGGIAYITNSSAKRERILVGQVQGAGDSSAVTALAAAGTGAAISSIVWGPGWVKFTLTTGTGASASGDFVDVTFPHAFPTGSVAWISGGSSGGSTFSKNGYTTDITSKSTIGCSSGIASSTAYAVKVFFQGY